MCNGWTGGQYSAFRAVFGLCLVAYFMIPVGDPGRIVMVIAALFFAIGLFDQPAALVMLAVLAWMFDRNPLVANPSLLLVGWLLIAHLFLPPAPYGSVAARKRVDPRGGWSMPAAIYAATWIVMVLGFVYGAYSRLTDPSLVNLGRVLTIFFVPLAVFARLRPWIWSAMLAINCADPALGILMLQFFTFDPKWFAPLFPTRRDCVLYDGSCGLCHRAVRFLLSEDLLAGFTFAPLPTDVPQQTVVVETEGGSRLFRSDAARYILARLGGLWRIAAVALGLVPRAIRNFGYDMVARTRYRIFGRAKQACPNLPADLRARFTI